MARQAAGVGPQTLSENTTFVVCESLIALILAQPDIVARIFTFVAVRIIILAVDRRDRVARLLRIVAAVHCCERSWRRSQWDAVGINAPSVHNESHDRNLWQPFLAGAIWRSGIWREQLTRRVTGVHSWIAFPAHVAYPRRSANLSAAIAALPPVANSADDTTHQLREGEESTIHAIYVYIYISIL